jgi:hypothetical protein
VSDDDEQEPAPEHGESDPLRRTLDLFVFAPVGVALTVAEDLPSLIAKGRDRVETQIRNARVIGEFVVTQGQKEVASQVGKLLRRDGGSDGGSDAEGPGDEPRAPESPVEAAETPASAPPAPMATPKPAADPADAAIVESALAGYDTLSASQVVRRLESLGPDELRAVHRHEASHRNRRTILNRAGQLLDGNGTTPLNGVASQNGSVPSESDAPPA